MEKQKINALHSGEQRILEISLMKNIEKAVIIEDNNVYTYGYKLKDGLQKS